MSAYWESCYSHLVHGIIDAFQHNQHAVERLLQLLGAAAAVAEAQQILQQQLIFGDALHGLQKISGQRQLVTQSLLTLLQKQVGVDKRFTQTIRAWYILAIERVQPVEGITLKVQRDISQGIPSSTSFDLTYPLHKTQRDKFRGRNAVLQVLEKDLVVKCVELMQIAKKYFLLALQTGRNQVHQLVRLHLVKVALKRENQSSSL